MLLFSTSFVMSVLFGDVKTEKICSSCVTGRQNIAIFSEHKNLPRFLPKGGRSSDELFITVSKTDEMERRQEIYNNTTIKYISTFIHVRIYYTVYMDRFGLK